MNIIITGASRGIGFDTAIELAKDPLNHIIALSRNEEKLRSLYSARTTATGIRNVEFFKFDISDFTINQLEEILAPHHKIDILINNAGKLINKSFLDLEMADWESIFDVNLFGTVKLTKAIFPYLVRNGGGHIVNIGSMGGVQGTSKFNGLSAYSASKAALANLTECLAEEWRGDNIRVNCLALGSVNTDMLKEAFPGYKAPVSSDEMAKFISQFALTAHKFVNGKIIPVSIDTP